MLTPIRLPANIIRIAVFLRPEDLPGPKRDIRPLSWHARARHLNRLVTQAPIVFAGDEPIRCAGFYHLLDGLRRDLRIEIETRLEFDVGEWLARVPPDRFDAMCPEPTLRARFDPRTMEAEAAIERALLLQGAGFQIAVRAVLVPTHKAQALAAADRGRRAGLDCATEPFFGWLDRQLFGQYRYQAACQGREGQPAGWRRVRCQSNQLLVSPSGALFGCRHDLAAGAPVVGRLSEEQPRLVESFRPCDAFGLCHPRDVALTVDDHGRFAEPLVEIVQRGRGRAARRGAAAHLVDSLRTS